MDVLILRRFPKALHSFKSLGGGLLQIIGIFGTVYMVLNISTDPAGVKRLMAGFSLRR